MSRYPEMILGDLLAPQLGEVGAVMYLSRINECLIRHHNAELMLQGQGLYMLKLGTLEDTLLKDDRNMLEEWEECYLPEHMRMQVLGEVHHTGLNSSLVLMVCEDSKVYGYADEQLHLVAEDLKALINEGITFPSKVVYHYGQSFEGMTEEELKEVRASDEMKKAKKIQKKLAKKWELKILEAFREVKDCYEVSRDKNISDSPVWSSWKPPLNLSRKRGHECIQREVSV